MIPVSALMDTPEGCDEHGTPDHAIVECDEHNVLYRAGGECLDCKREAER